MRTQIRAAGILVAGGAVILENAIGTDLWNLRGGRLEDMETLELAVRREFQEEMGLAVACEDGHIRVLFTRNEDLIGEARRRAGRPLTDAERAAYLGGAPGDPTSP